MKNRWMMNNICWQGAGEGTPAPTDDPTPAPASMISGETPPANPTDTSEPGASLISPDAKPEFVSEPIPFGDETFVEDIKDLIPENFEVDPEGMKEFLDGINGAQSRADIAKYVLNAYAEVQKQQQEAAAGEFTSTVTDWQKQVREHPEYGGANLDQSLANAKLVAQTYGGDGFFKLLEITGAGSHPEMVAFLNKVHKEMPKEGQPLRAPNVPTERKSLADRLFTSTENK